MSQPAYNYADVGSYCSFLIWWPIVEVMAGYEDTFCRFLNRDSVRRYPDRSICLETTTDFMDAEAIIRPYRQSGFEIYQNTRFRSLGFFPSRDYLLWTTSEYFRRLGAEQGLIVAPIDATPEIGEAFPERLPVQVKWWKRQPSAAVQKSFAETLDAWAKSVSQTGIFGEGPAKLHAQSLSFTGTWASFFIDVHNSGQHTVNWLTLSILNMAAASTQAVSWICYGRELNQDELLKSKLYDGPDLRL